MNESHTEVQSIRSEDKVKLFNMTAKPIPAYKQVLASPSEAGEKITGFSVKVLKENNEYFPLQLSVK